uniref:Calcineurin-like phosphoesterase domain-containing protein n=2 Tax=viral metagenome TaxID=1070528 RepID=A0A6M3X9B1_9ZZZZ
MLNNAIVVGDLHAGCQLALCPPTIQLMHGGEYHASKFQMVLWDKWRYIWDVWVPRVTKGEPFAVVLNGDGLDGRHHNSTTQITQNLSDQENIGYELLAPIIDQCKGLFYYISGTAVHAGEAGENEEKLAKRIGVIQDETGNYSRYEMYLDVGGAHCHFTHHIGVSGSGAYESTALTKEFNEFCADSAKWGKQRPDVIVRSHRHRHIEVRVPTDKAYGIIFTTAAWQLKTPFLFRVPGGRTTTPMIGASLIRQGDEEHFTRHKTWDTARTKTEQPNTEVYYDGYS